MSDGVARPSNNGRIAVVFHLWNPTPLTFPLVTSSEEQRALTSLAQLLAQDLSKVETDELVNGILRAELVGRSSPDWSGRLIAALHNRGVSWSEIVKLTGLAQTTAWRRAEPYM
jgi:hypothetical protein